MYTKWLETYTNILYTDNDIIISDDKAVWKSTLLGIFIQNYEEDI